MPVVVIVAAVAVAAAVPLLWWAVAGSTNERTLVSRELLGVGGSPDLRQAVLAHSAGQRAVQPTLRVIAQRVRAVTPIGWVEGLERRLTLAGRPPAWPLERVLAAKVLLGAGALLLGFAMFAGNRTFLQLLMWMGMTALAYFTPDLLLYSKGTERQKRIQMELPDTLDQMTISVEAGLGFDSAMARAGQSGTGPLAEELVRTLQEVQVGVARSKALRNLGDRTTVPDLRHFVLAVIQAEGYGIPVADVLRVQAAELRVKRRQRAEERAMKIPVKVIFPLILCILPTMFIVIMGPAVIRISRALFGSGGAL